MGPSPVGKTLNLYVWSSNVLTEKIFSSNLLSIMFPLDRCWKSLWNVNNPGPKVFPVDGSLPSSRMMEIDAVPIELFSMYFLLYCLFLAAIKGIFLAFFMWTDFIHTGAIAKELWNLVKRYLQDTGSGVKERAPNWKLLSKFHYKFS